MFLSAHINVDRSPLGGAMQSMLTIRRPTGITNIEIALGWHVSRRRDHEVAWHNGCTGGYSSFIAFSPVDRVGVVILANTAVDVDNLGFSIFDYLLPIAIK